MNTIKGLIIKDLLQLKSYRKTLLVYILIFILISITQDSVVGVGSMLILMLTFGFGMFSMASFNYDEQASCDAYLLTLPVTRKKIVKAKYLFVIFSTLIGAIVGMLISFIAMFVMSKQIPNLYSFFEMALGSILGIGIMESIQIPCIYKLGAEKGRIQIFVIGAFFLLLCSGFLFLQEKLNVHFSWQPIITFLHQALPVILIIAICLVYFISYKIASKIYLKKEF